MKKAILLIGILTIMTTSAYSQGDSIKYVTNTDAERLIDKYVEKIESGIVAMSEKLQQPAEYVYKILIKQQFIRGFAWIAAMIIGLILALIFYLVATKYGNVREYDKQEVCYSIMGTALFLFTIGLIGFLIFGVSSLINPEYKAIKEIVSFIK